MKKRIISMLLIGAISITSTVPALASSNPNNEVATHNHFTFVTVDESPLEEFARINPHIDMDSVTITDDFDILGNRVYTITTGQAESIYNEVTLAQIATVFLDDPTIEARLEGNTLFYTLPDGTEGKFTETVYPNGVRSFLSVENGDIQKLVFDSINEQMLLDDAVVKGTFESIYTIQQVSSNLSWSHWVFVHTSHQNLTTEQAISTMHTSIFIAVATAGLAPKPAMAIGIALAIINFFADINPNARTVYVTRRMYRTLDFFVIRLVDRHYSHPERTPAQFINTRTSEIM